jgi:hypothetical protein
MFYKEVRLSRHYFDSLRRTLPKNLKEIEHDSDRFEISLLNYNSSTILDEWILNNLQEHINSGLLKYHHNLTVKDYHNSIAKNQSHKLASGDILFNLDIDNFISNSHEVIYEEFTKDPDIVLNTHDFEVGSGTCGRIGISKVNFLKLGGYDEHLPSSGTWEDIDFLDRAEVFGLKKVQITDKRYFHAIENSKDSTTCLSGKEFELAMEENSDKSFENIRKKLLVANAGKKIGNAGRVVRVPLRESFEGVKMKTAFSESHEKLFDSHFRKYFLDEGIDLEIERLPQECKSARLFSEGWVKTTTRKLESILDSLERCGDNDLFIYADADVSFYGGVKSDLEKLISGYDILFQKDHNVIDENDFEVAAYCTGFFVARANEKIKSLFEESIRKIKQNDTAGGVEFIHSDQSTVNSVIKLKKMSSIKRGFLPERYYTHGLYIEGIKDFSEENQSGLWWQNKTEEEKENIYIPHNLKIHHANWCVGVENKLELLNSIRRRFI